ncbi:LysE family translocator [Thalassolituus sp. LLYu03]|uniref:LysE family translocator n=1 Tax=Thalassolituus sp. LLYu03 TaxID=3421656 RepID=UPI003D2D5469
MPDVLILAAFIPTFFFVSVTPGMAMTLAMSTGMSVGMRGALWMSVGELTAVGLVSTAAAVGVAALMLNFPLAFLAFRLLGGLYLMFLGWQLWHSRGKLAVVVGQTRRAVQPALLIRQGFITAAANPKGWAFDAVLLPPFLDAGKPFMAQWPVLLIIILVIEFLCLMLYAAGGKSLGQFLNSHGRIQTLNRISGGLMGLVGLWLMLGG